jgi:hypothetical protein
MEIVSGLTVRKVSHLFFYTRALQTASKLTIILNYCSREPHFDAGQLILENSSWVSAVTWDWTIHKELDAKGGC